MKIVKKMSKILAAMMAATLLSTSVISCTSNNIDNSFNNGTENGGVDNGNNNNGGNNGGDIGEPEIPTVPDNPDYEINRGSISESILSKIEFDINTLNRVESNNFNLKQNASDYLANGNFNGFKGSKNGVYNDINRFVYQLWIDNKKNTNIFNLNILNLEIYDKKTLNSINQFHFGDLISFNFSFKLRAFQNNTIFKVLNHEIKLNKNEIKLIEFSVNKATINPFISNQSESFYLTWKVDKIEFRVDNSLDQEAVFNDLVITPNSPSLSFKTIFTNLVQKYSYIDVYQKYQNELTKISASDFETSIVNQIDKEFDSKLSLIRSGIDILKVLKDNPTPVKFIQTGGSSILSLLGDLNLIPKKLVPLLTTFLNSNTPFINLIDQHRQEIKDILSNEIGDISGTISFLLDSLKPNLTEDSEEFQTIKIILDLLPPEIQEVIKVDFLGIGGKAKSLSELLYDNISLILNMFPTSGTVSDIFGIVKEFANIIFDKQNQNIPILNIIFDSKENKRKIVDVLKTVFGLSPEIVGILNVILVESKSFNVNNILAVLNDIYNFANELFLENTSYDNFANRFKNLEFTKEFAEKPTINRNDLRISFNYEIKVRILKPVKLNLKNIKLLIDDDTFKAILKQFNDKNIQQLPEFTNGAIKEHILKLLPDTIELGNNPQNEKFYNKFEFSAKNTKVLIEPIRKNKDYVLGYQFLYEEKFLIQDASLIRSFTNQFSYLKDKIIDSSLGAINLEIYYGKFWQYVLEHFVLRQYSFTKKLKAKTVNDIRLFDANEYEPNLYIDGYSFETQDDIVDSSTIDFIYPYQNGNQQYYPIDSNLRNYIYNQTWKNSSGTINLKSYQPVITDMNKKLLENKFVVHGLKNSQLYPTVLITPLINVEIPLSIFLSQGNNTQIMTVKLKSQIFTSTIYFPFKIYDSKNKKMTDFQSYTTSFTKIIESQIID